jgi:ligand-binding sensor domain-containing protein
VSDDPSWRQVWRAIYGTGGVRDLLRDGDWLWVATPADVVRLNLRTLDCTRFDLREVRSLLPGPDGRLWAVGNTRLARFDGQRWQTVLNSLWADNIAFDASDNLWTLASWEGYRGLVWVRYSGHEPPENGSWEKEHIQPPPPDACDRWTARSRQFRSSEECRLLASWRERLALQSPPADIAPWKRDQPIAAESDEHLWILAQSRSGEAGRYDTLLHFDGQEWQSLPWRYGSGHLVADEARGGVWVGTSEGLVFSDGQSIQKYLLTLGDTAPIGSSVRDLTVDGSGRLWALTDQKLLLYDETLDAWQTIRASEWGLLISADDRGGLWVAPRDLSGRVSYFDGATWTHYPPPGRWPCYPESILADAGGGLWLSSYSCALRGFDGEVWDEYDNGSRGDMLFRGPDGAVYTAGENGLGNLKRYDGNTWKSLLPTYHMSVIDLVVGPKGEVWVACDAPFRLFVYRDGEWEQAHETGDEVIQALFIDSRGDLWAGHDGGLLHYDGETWEQIESEFSLVGTNALVKDRQGRIWVGGKYGLRIYDPAETR